METQNEQVRDRRIKSKLVDILYRIVGRYHDSKAYYLRYDCNEYDLSSYTPGISSEERERLQQQANRCAIQARYHEKMAKQYGGGSD